MTLNQQSDFNGSPVLEMLDRKMKHMLVDGEYIYYTDENIKKLYTDVYKRFRNTLILTNERLAFKQYRTLRDEAIYTLWKEGSNLSEICKGYGLSKRYVQNIVYRKDAEMKPRTKLSPQSTNDNLDISNFIV